jgi:NAD(P)-dependent dehydrogenase (short-subunit alcohol dehydrogenase family)
VVQIHQRTPRPKALAGKIAAITGGADGIGLPTARELLDDSVCVVLCDIDRGTLTNAERELSAEQYTEALAGVWVDVTT